MPIDLKHFRCERITRLDVAIVVLAALLIGILIGAQGVRMEIKSELSRIEAAAVGDYIASEDLEAPAQAAKARHRLVRETNGRRP